MTLSRSVLILNPTIWVKFFIPISIYQYMKYLITESKLDKVIFKYLDNQDFIQINKNNSIYFVNSEGDKYAQIRYVKDDGVCVGFIIN